MTEDCYELTNASSQPCQERQVWTYRVQLQSNSLFSRGTPNRANGFPHHKFIFEKAQSSTWNFRMAYNQFSHD